MVHRALLGSVERFFGILIEHYAGAFPLWLAPTQVEICPVSEKVADLRETRSRNPGRTTAFACISTIATKSCPQKSATPRCKKFPIMLVVGPKEAEAGTVSVRPSQQG